MVTSLVVSRKACEKLCRTELPGAVQTSRSPRSRRTRDGAGRPPRSADCGTQRGDHVIELHAAELGKDGQREHALGQALRCRKVPRCVAAPAPDRLEVYGERIVDAGLHAGPSKCSPDPIAL